MVGVCDDDERGCGSSGGALGDRRFGGRVRCGGCGEFCRYLWWLGGLVYCRRCMPGVFLVWRPPDVGFRFRGYPVQDVVVCSAERLPGAVVG